MMPHFVLHVIFLEIYRTDFWFFFSKYPNGSMPHVVDYLMANFFHLDPLVRFLRFSKSREMLLFFNNLGIRIHVFSVTKDFFSSNKTSEKTLTIFWIPLKNSSQFLIVASEFGSSKSGYWV